ncbi:PQQ-dependent sugar dehydrogenase [Marivirga arenosa]|uniref:PQQ-dependent sugar dehydrogenase n=1 Tax=Marivirga arenosa TaxID=3059076 RepID=A0AA51N8D1_9BACT|nr:PQQ-dependent sugar dehydrogenase [Marivirga sp. ABR2-2]WMN07953.1 PQQ-dependent sugar dehydrogenase [Marivirga sp. ABR2-2]
MRTLAALKFLSLLFIINFSCNAEPESNLKDDFEVVTIADGLENPWGMTWLPDGKMLVTEKRGEILVIENDAFEGVKLKGVPEVYNRGQGGLLDIQAHPNYAENGWIYFSYAKPGKGGGSTAIMRAKLDGNQLVNKELIYESFPKTNSGVHFGSRIDFKEGYIFFSIGERGEMENAQSVGNPFGKIHRLYENGDLPEDNPFVKIPDAEHSIWSYGHRNPQGLQFHPATGNLWEHEHGPKGGDELNIVEKAKNYGWPEITYGIDYDGTIISNETEKEGMMQPEHYWDPSIAPCGMTFVSSDRYPSWKGDLLLGSLKFQYLCRVNLDDEGKYIKEEKLLKGIGRVRHVAESPDGYIYVAVEGPGKIVKLVPKK